MKSWRENAWLVTFGVLCGLLAAGLILLVARLPRHAALRLSPPPTPRPLVIDVSGAVAQPGVYSLAPGSRVSDALDAAGGLLPEADSQAINQAALLLDGQKLHVPLEPAALGPDQGAGEAPGATPGALIDINRATAEELDQLPGIGPVTAQSILAYRLEHGAFTSIEAIQQVPGIGPRTYEQIKAYITVEESP
jgi:competence protein ComEA